MVFASSGAALVATLIVSVVLLILMISKWHIHPFISLFSVALMMGLVAGLPVMEVTNTITAGFGSTCRSIGIIILFGTFIGSILEGSGATITMARTVLKRVGAKRPALAMGIIGWIVSIPVFCDSGFVILSALNRSLAKSSGAKMVTLVIALSTGLYASHTLVPPTPGPISAAANLGADLGLLVFWGVVVSIPAMLAGYLYATLVGSRLEITASEKNTTWEELLHRHMQLPSPSQAFVPILIPLLLITLNSLTNYPPILTIVGRESVFHTALSFIGHPVNALFIGLILCAPLITIRRSNPEANWSSWITKGMRDGASIIMITAAGGSFGAVIAATNVGVHIGEQLVQFNLGIFLPFVVAAALKTAQGSSTVALITTSNIIAPLLPSLGLYGPMGAVLATLSIGCGAMVVSHANDSYFWVVTQFSEMDIGVAYKAQTVATLIEGIAGVSVVWMISLILL